MSSSTGVQVVNDGMRYDIDVAGVRGTLRVAQGHLEDLSVQDVRSAGNDVENGLGASRTRAAFSRYADEVLVRDTEATLIRIRNAIGGVSTAMDHYVAADHTMTADALRAARALPPRPAARHPLSGSAAEQ
ncbi:DUF6507 family protein [Arthrobacter gengyunqii]|uniref:DUF6507 family protein n=1 Tax=Arthrobacter gengyunqii TaxID=2886940 RepID=A0A9X1M393_9MICC|nr:DUF6507 family protein [Arthrobacter gengyunqii]MCC3270080.1 DUF6507 family protein [Arthrobacter gengyunqii]UOY95006.1 DUF6507 family protein [Arthrobacter gengyunqii]